MVAEQVQPDIFDPSHHKLKPGIQLQLDTLLKEYETQFAKDETSIGTMPLMEMTINTGGSDPLSQKPYPIAIKNYQWVKEEIEKLLTGKDIHSSRSSWSAPIIVVPTGDRGKWLVIDYQALNRGYQEVYLDYAKSEDIFSKLNGPKYFSTLDLRASYHHIPLDKSSILKTAFNSPFGKYEYVKVTFGLAQAPAYFQELMKGILKDFDFVITYLDNIIFSRTAEEHLSHIRKVFKKLQLAKLSMKLNKCHFFSKEIQYLGHILSTKCICPLPIKTHAIQMMHPPTTPKQVCVFLGLVGYYRKFIKDFTKITKLLTLLMRQQVKFEWTLAHHEALPETKRFHNTGTHSTIPQTQQEIYSLHRHIGWCLQSPVDTRTQWHRSSNCLLISHFLGDPKKVEHNWTIGLWSLLCCHQVELPSPRCRHHSQKRSQATYKIFECEKMQITK